MHDLELIIGKKVISVVPTPNNHKTGPNYANASLLICFEDGTELTLSPQFDNIKEETTLEYSLSLVKRGEIA